MVALDAFYAATAAWGEAADDAGASSSPGRGPHPQRGPAFAKFLGGYLLELQPSQGCRLLVPGVGASGEDGSGPRRHRVLFFDSLVAGPAAGGDAALGSQDDRFWRKQAQRVAEALQAQTVSLVLVQKSVDRELASLLRARVFWNMGVRFWFILPNTWMRRYGDSCPQNEHVKKWPVVSGGYRILAPSHILVLSCANHSASITL